MHGKLGHSEWSMPRLVASSLEKARPDHSSLVDASEYMDEPDVLDKKISLLASLIEKSQNFVALTGAGISTSIGITDYASRAQGSLTIGKQIDVDKNDLAGNNLARKSLAMNAEPTLSHRILSSLEKKNLLKHWIYLNYDGLPEKAGYPKDKLNEFHGSWFDSDNNPVALTDNDLRPDLIRWLEEWEQKADLCLAMGTSLCGMKADCVAATVAAKNGLVIINLQRTPYDELAVLRIFATCDQAMNLLGQKMNLNIT